MLSITIVSVISLLHFMVATPYEIDGMSDNSGPPIAFGDEIMNKLYKNKTITINPLSEKNESLLTIDGISIKVFESNGKYFTPVLPYSAYNSLITMAKNIVDLMYMFETNQTSSIDSEKEKEQ